MSIEKWIEQSKKEQSKIMEEVVKRRSELSTDEKRIAGEFFILGIRYADEYRNMIEIGNRFHRDETFSKLLAQLTPKRLSDSHNKPRKKWTRRSKEP